MSTEAVFVLSEQENPQDYVSGWRDTNHSYVFTVRHLITRMLFDRLPHSGQENV